MIILIATVAVFSFGIYCGWQLKKLHAQDVIFGLECALDAVKQALEKERLK